MLYPCSVCDRHLRDSEPSCPFCGAAQSLVEAPSLGAVALVVALLGSTGCARDPVPADTAGTTTSMSTATETTTADTSTADTSTDDTTLDTDATTDNSDSFPGSFYAGPTDFVNPSSCDIFVQDCPEGEKCVPYSTTGEGFDANKCVPVTGDGQPGDECTYGGTLDATDDCGADSQCWSVDDTGIGTCTEFCQGSPDEPTCPMGSQHCFIGFEGSVALCVTDCDPRLQDCNDGYGCYFGEEFMCMEAIENIPLGDPCDAVNDCMPGLTCMPAEEVPDCAGDSCCASFCDISAPMCPQIGTSCAPIFDIPLPGYEDVGVCVAEP